MTFFIYLSLALLVVIAMVVVHPSRPNFGLKAFRKVFDTAAAQFGAEHAKIVVFTIEETIKAVGEFTALKEANNAIISGNRKVKANLAQAEQAERKALQLRHDANKEQKLVVEIEKLKEAM